MVAHRLGYRSVGDAKRRLTYQEFVAWVEFFRRDARKHDKTDHYAAGLRLEIRMLNRMVRRLLNFSGAPLDLGAEPTDQDFLLRYTDDTADDAPPPARACEFSPADGNVYLAVSKAAWAARMGLTG